MSQAISFPPTTSINHSLRSTQALFQVLSGALFITLCAKIAIPLFFSPVPITMQTFAIMILGGLLGKERGALCAATYILGLAMGLPIASDTSPGLITLLGCKGGYLLGFIPQAYLVGWFLEGHHQYRPAKTLLALLSSCLMLLTLGTTWLSYFVGWDKALVLGFYPFLPGAMAKCFAATTFLKKYRKQG